MLQVDGLHVVVQILRKERFAVDHGASVNRAHQVVRHLDAEPKLPRGDLQIRRVDGRRDLGRVADRPFRRLTGRVNLEAEQGDVDAAAGDRQVCCRVRDTTRRGTAPSAATPAAARAAAAVRKLRMESPPLYFTCHACV